MKILHNTRMTEFRNPFGAVECGTVIEFNIWVTPDESEKPPYNIYLRWWHGDNEYKVPMIHMNSLNPVLHSGHSDNFQKPFLPEHIYSYKYTMPKTAGLAWYYFVIETEKETLYYGNNKNEFGGIGCVYSYPPPSFQVTVYEKGFKTPDWFKNAVIYQIFTDRFYNGNPNRQVTNLKHGYHIYKDWYEPMISPYDSETGEPLKNDFYGGNLSGIIKKLPYLKELGISVIYLNPIFEAYSNHKYDTGDYENIDPMFGDNSIFELMCNEGKKYGISFILDGVFNHTGSDSKYFNKRGSYDTIGAYQDKNSPYFSWYRFYDYPDKYECWWGVKTLPHTEENDPGFQDYIIYNKNSICKSWIKRGAMGWRLDVVDELPSEFVKGLRSEIKKTNPEAVIIGEVWEDASKKVSYGEMREYLLGKELDSVMNYPFRDSVLDFILGNTTAEFFNDTIMSLYENYPKECFYSLMNLTGSHDVSRIKTILGEAETELNDSEKAVYRLTSDKQELARKRIKLLSIIQMTFPGVPCIYYGDEIGMEGHQDPFNRAPFAWNCVDIDLLDWYRALIELRNATDALKTGEFIPLYCNGGTYAFARRITDVDVFNEKKENGFIISVINVSKETESTVSIDLSIWQISQIKASICTEEIDHKLLNNILYVKLPPLSGCILL